jgi:short-chain fatty acids transporter
MWLIFIMGFSYIVYWFYSQGLNLNMNIFNFLLICLALPFYDTPMRFLKSMERSNRAFYGILIQFPFYAGIQGMLLSSGMAPILFERITSGATATTYLFWVYVDGVLINFFVPMAGGIWEIHNSLVAQKGAELGIGISRALHAFNAGGAIGNVIQPFWAIPVLGICGLSLRDIMGYCFMAFLALSFIWVLLLFFMPL